MKEKCHFLCLTSGQGFWMLSLTLSKMKSSPLGAHTQSLPHVSAPIALMTLGDACLPHHVLHSQEAGFLWLSRVPHVGVGAGRQQSLHEASLCGGINLEPS